MVSFYGMYADLDYFSEHIYLYFVIGTIFFFFFLGGGGGAGLGFFRGEGGFHALNPLDRTLSG